MRRRIQPTGTNRPKTCFFPVLSHPPIVVESLLLLQLLEGSSGGEAFRFPQEPAKKASYLLAPMEKGVYPAPFRTRKSSPSSPMILHIHVWESRPGPTILSPTNSAPRIHAGRCLFFAEAGTLSCPVRVPARADASKKSL